MSGENCFDILNKIFLPKKNEEIENIKGYSIKYGHIVENKKIVDEVLVSYFKAPKSYTTENMCEINTHGGIVIVRKILDLCLKNGARIAEPGEFTKRAFLNGRIDLSQAESVIDIINAKSEKEVKTSINQLEGNLSKKIKQIKQQILDVMVNLEVSIDYPEYDTPDATENEILNMLNNVEKELLKLENSFDNGKLIKEGIKTAIIGKPNVGKSTFFNYLAGSRISIVEDTPGVTRDRIYADTNWRGRNFTLIDTGGIEPESEDIILSQMREQANLAISMANVIVFVTDIRQGVTAADREIALMLKKSGKPIVLVCNKADNFEKDREEIYEFYNLGLGDPFPISASNALGIGDVLDEIYKDFPEKEDGEDDDTTIKVAIIGKPNVGKSSLINKLLGENRAIVSDIAGTTRDAIDTNLENEHGKYVFIDTAGIRRKSKVKESIEKFSIMRTLLAVERADVCLMMIDALEGVTDQDAKIAGEAHEAGKGIIIVVNKWDEYEKGTGTLEKYKKEIYNKLSYLSYAPIIFISAKTGQRVNKLFDLINFVAEQNALRVSTSVLNQVINEAIAIVQPPTDKGKRLKIFYATQASTKPPTFVIFVNNKELFHFSYERYLVNNIRKEFGLEGTPVRVIVREKTEKGGM